MGHLRARQPWWWCLWENIFKKGKKMLLRQWGVREKVREVVMGTPRFEKEGKRCSRYWRRDSPAESTMVEQVGVFWRSCGLWRSHSGTGLSCGTAACGQGTKLKWEKCEEEGGAERNCYRLPTAPHYPAPCAAQGGGQRRESNQE